MCAECGCGQSERFGVQPLQAPPAKPVRLLDDADALPHEHEHVHADGTRHAHPHVHPPGAPHEGADAHEDSHAHSHAHAHADGTTHAHPHGHDHEHPAAHTHTHPAGATAGRATLDIHQPILARNARLAERNRGYLKARGVRALNLLSSPGAGKTTLIEKTIAAFDAGAPLAVIVGDLATANDAARIRRAGAPVVQITTGTACHLDAEMVARGLEQLDLERRPLLLIENVGNLVCPADFDLGEELRVVLLSVTEGEDKPLKYPPMFRSAHAVVVTKLDLAAATGADLELLRRNLDATAPRARRFELSARTGDGMAAWISWLRGLAGGR
jgi:hydrogenase nickel incorporation protein HypB